jgi:signal transduction histidine kinase
LLNARREMLRTVIQAQELERIELAKCIEYNVNQTLVFCKAMVSETPKQNQNEAFFKQIAQAIHQAIDELNTQSSNLNPPDLELLVFRAGVENFIETYRSRNSIEILFGCYYGNIEQIDLTDKFSLFRAIQDFILLLDNNPHSTTANIMIKSSPSHLIIELSQSDRNFLLQKDSKEFKDIDTGLNIMEA